MKRTGSVGGLGLVTVLALAGCGDFRERAMEAQQIVEEARETAQTAEQAAAANTGRIRQLEDRIEALEASLEEIQAALGQTDTTADTDPENAP